MPEIDSNAENSRRGTGEVPLQLETENRKLPPMNVRHDIAQPFSFPFDEAIAQYLSLPRPIREFQSFDDLAKHFGVSRMTVYRRSRNHIMLKRVCWLLESNRAAGMVFVRQNWIRIVRGQVHGAIRGDAKALQFCREEAMFFDEPTIDDVLRK